MIWWGVAFHDWLLHLDVKETPEWDQRSNPEFPLYYSAILHSHSPLPSVRSPHIVLCRVRREWEQAGGNNITEICRANCGDRHGNLRGVVRRTDNLYHPHSWTRPSLRDSLSILPKWNSGHKKRRHTVGWITWLIAPLWRFLSSYKRSEGRGRVCVSLHPHGRQPPGRQIANATSAVANARWNNLHPGPAHTLVSSLSRVQFIII
jgi:hypothetical protein